jgi:hypothetical protein
MGLAIAGHRSHPERVVRRHSDERTIVSGVLARPGERSRERVMEDVVLGFLAVLIGAVLCFRGYLALRVVIAMWGSLVGFLVGAGIVAGVTGESFLASVLAWSTGLGVAVVFGLVAYLYYAVSVVIGIGAIGFTLGTTAMVALGVNWSWVVALVGLTVGVVLALVSIAGDLPMLLLALLSALAGASIVILGLLLIGGVLDGADLAAGQTTATLNLAWWWHVLYGVLVVVGMGVQLRSAATRAETLRTAWAA